MRRVLLKAAAVATLLALGGCAGINSLPVQVSTYGEWPAGRAPGRYAFERLPSQEAQADQQQRLEAAAAPALARAGFSPVASGETPDLLVQVGARSSRSELAVWDDPFWWHGGLSWGRRGPWRGPMWSFGMSTGYPYSRSVEREVALLVRERDSAKPLFEARASSDGLYALDARIAQAMFDAALTDFPRVGINPRTVNVPMP
jgi:Domain of unknown function (DUF4136)